MFIRKRTEVNGVNWGNGSSHRLLTKKDEMGFTVCHTVVKAGTESRLQYLNHLEACYCIGGSGHVKSADGSQNYHIEPGTIYVLNEHDAHFLIASPHEDLELISVFNPPLTGDEVHKLDGNGFSQY